MKLLLLCWGVRDRSDKVICCGIFLAWRRKRLRLTMKMKRRRRVMDRGRKKT